MADHKILIEVKSEAAPIYYCSFCGKSQGEVLILIAGPIAYICDECTDLSAEIVKMKREENAATALLLVPAKQQE